MASTSIMKWKIVYVCCLHGRTTCICLSRVIFEISQNCDTKYVFAMEWLVICIDSSPAVARATNDQGHNAIIIFSHSYTFSLIWHMWNRSES